MRLTTRVSSFLVTTLAVLVASVGLAGPASAAYDNVPTATVWEPDGPVHAILVSGDRVYLGGDFTHLTNPSTGEVVARGHLAALDATTGDLVRTWSADADGGVRALAMSADGSQVLAGGAFLTVDGATRRRLVSLSPTDGAVLSPWKGSAAGVVRDLAVVGTTVYVAGAFKTLNGVADRGVGALQVSDGTRVSGFSASADATVYALTVVGPTLVLGGEFTSVTSGGTTLPRNALASVSLDTGAVTSWKPPLLCARCGKVWDLTADAAQVYAAIGRGGNRVAAFDAVTGAAHWSTRGNGDVQAVSLGFDGLLYVGGHFNTSFGGQDRRQLAAVDPLTGAVDPDFAPKMITSYPGVWALAATPAALWAGGHHTAVVCCGRSAYVARFPLS